MAVVLVCFGCETVVCFTLSCHITNDYNFPFFQFRCDVICIYQQKLQNLLIPQINYFLILFLDPKIDIGYHDNGHIQATAQDLNYLTLIFLKVRYPILGKIKDISRNISFTQKLPETQNSHPPNQSPTVTESFSGDSQTYYQTFTCAL